MPSMGISQGNIGGSNPFILSPLRRRKGLALITGQPSTTRGKHRPTLVPSQVCVHNTGIYVLSTCLNLYLSTPAFLRPYTKFEVLGDLNFPHQCENFVFCPLVSEQPTVTGKAVLSKSSFTGKIDLHYPQKIYNVQNFKFKTKF